MKGAYIFLVLLLLSSCFMFNSDYKLELNNITFLVPKGFDRLQANPQKDEILKLRYKDEMYIIVQDNVARRIKESKIEKRLSMDLVHDIKFKAIKQAYNGYHTTKKESYHVGGRRITLQEFTAKEHFGEAYYRYSIVETNNTFIEVLFTGPEQLHEGQKEISERFLRSIDK